MAARTIKEGRPSPGRGGFLEPTVPKVVFLAEWAVFILISALRGELSSPHLILVAAYPLLFFYLVACLLARAARRSWVPTSTRALLWLSLGLLALDQLVKFLVTTSIAYGEAVALVPGWLHLAHARNTLGAWILTLFTDTPVPSFLAVAKVLLPAFAAVAVLGYRYYSHAYRRSPWAAVAFAGIFAALASWSCDMVLRGFIVDYLALPDLVVADLKDIYVTVGVAALLVEYLETSNAPFAWRGWREELTEAQRIVGGLIAFARRDLRALFSLRNRDA
jgi:signal peptidase II